METNQICKYWIENDAKIQPNEGQIVRFWKSVIQSISIFWREISNETFSVILNTMCQE